MAHGRRPLLSSHTFPPGIPVGISPLEFPRKAKLMFGGMPPNIPHLPTQEDPHSEILLSTATIAHKYGCMPLICPSTLSCYNPLNIGYVDVNLGPPNLG
ncbi:hypothetical protein O181_097481 [Austropuccinia psidii MF-1]|uniref:Uncharacterized protein n=1 Tax=Austropuccinia psidii MF-1 TaxID=1389203 RepID=A0A9Q3PF51_9BASI|nr:hypothetical protein [Austropuccinia psidii MF-1]